MALVLLGQLAGAVPSDGDQGETAAPDATWIFADAMWVVWEAKSEARPEGELGADDVREANGHLRFVADRRQQAAPGDSVVLLMAPQDRIHPSARAIAEDHVYRVFATEVVDLLDRLLRAWRTLRTRDLDTLTVTNAAAIFAAEQALPSQWLPRLRTRRLNQKEALA